MHCCEFCHNQFTPRKQVKKPRACFDKNCQILRQRANEKAWKQKHIDQYDKEYHDIQRAKRLKEIETILKSILEFLNAGAKLFGKKINFDHFKVHFAAYFLRLGIRKINKFWNVEDVFNLGNIEATIT